MKTVMCKKCGKEYPSNMTRCPECKTMPVGVTVAVIILSVISVILMGVMIGMVASGETGTSDGGSKTDNINSECIEISANDIYSAFQENEIAANEKYKGKVVKITGIVGDINAKDTFTSANVLLRVDGTFFTGSVQCNFNTDESKALANISKGQSITIIGTCSGFATFNVVITSCEVCE